MKVPRRGFLHLAADTDLWTHRWRRKATGDVTVIRYADDTIVCRPPDDLSDRWPDKGCRFRLTSRARQVAKWPARTLPRAGLGRFLAVKVQREGASRLSFPTARRRDILRGMSTRPRSQAGHR